MRRPILSSLENWGKYTLNALFSLLVLAQAVTAEAADNRLPVLFDSRERLAKPDLSEIGRVRFVTTVDFAPFNFIDQTGRLAGFQVDLAREICDELKIAEKCQIQALPFAEIEAAVEGGQAEAAIAGVAVTPQLRRRFSFSRPFMELPARFVRNRKVSLPDEKAASLAGHPVGVVTGTRHAAMLQAFFPGLKAVEFADRNAMMEALKTDAVDAVFSDGLQLSFWTSGPASANCCAFLDGPYFSEFFLSEGMTVMLRKDDTVLTAAIDHALLTLSRNGRLQEIYLRYFPYGLY